MDLAVSPDDVEALLSEVGNVIASFQLTHTQKNAPGSTDENRLTPHENDRLTSLVGQYNLLTKRWDRLVIYASNVQLQRQVNNQGPLAPGLIPMVPNWFYRRGLSILKELRKLDRSVRARIDKLIWNRLLSIDPFGPLPPVHRPPSIGLPPDPWSPTPESDDPWAQNGVPKPSGGQPQFAAVGAPDLQWLRDQVPTTGDRTKALALTTRNDHGDESATRLGGGSILSKAGGGRGLGMGALASLSQKRPDTNTYAHHKKPGGGGGLPGGAGNPPASKSTTGGVAAQPKDNSNDAKGIAQTSRGDFVSTSSGGGGGPVAGGSTSTKDKDTSKGIDKSQERASGASKEVTTASTGGPNPTSTSTSTSTSSTTSTASRGSSGSGQGGNSPTTPGTQPTARTAKEQKERDAAENEKSDREKEAEKEKKRHGSGGGSMPNPEDSGSGGEGPSVSSAGAPNPETTGRFGSGELRIPARLRFSAMPNPEARSTTIGTPGLSGDDDGSDPSQSLTARFFDPMTFRYRVPGAFGAMPSDEGNTSTGGGLAGPRAYDAYPDPESSGGLGPKARYERPNPEDTGSPHGPSARTAISWSSATRNRMV